MAVLLFRIAPVFDRFFEGFTRRYERALAFCLRRRLAVAGVLAACLVPAVMAFLHTGEELFPEVDSSDFTVHLRATGGPRVEETERKVDEIEHMITDGHRADFQRPDVGGIPGSGAEGSRLRGRHRGSQRRGRRRQGGANWPPPLPSRTPTNTQGTRPDRNRGRHARLPHPAGDPGSGSGFGAVQRRPVVALGGDLHAQQRPARGLCAHAAALGFRRPAHAGERLREPIAAANFQYRWPTYDFFFETGGMLRRILNAGAVAPVEVQIYGRDNDNRREVARLLNKELSQLASVQDTYLPQGMDLPQLKVNVDRAKAARPGLTETDVVRNVITAPDVQRSDCPELLDRPQVGQPLRHRRAVPRVHGREHPDAGEDPAHCHGQPEARLRRPHGQRRPALGQEGDVSRPPVLRLEDVATIERS